MAPSERFHSIDQAIIDIREDHRLEVQELKDQLTATGIELALHKKLLADALRERAKWDRVATQLITQFGTVAKVFEEAKILAQSVEVDRRNDEEAAALAAPQANTFTHTTVLPPSEMKVSA